MSVFDKLAFWKKKEEHAPGLGGLGGLPPLPGERGGGADLGLPEIGTEPGFPTTPSTPAQHPAPQPETSPPPFAPITPQQYQVVGATSHEPSSTVNKDFEIISAKLDSIRASLESINQRLANIEKIAHGEQEKVNIRRQW